MNVVFSFDTEDFVTPEAADAQKWWAEMLLSRGLRGSFQCVGQVIRRLKERGREDVIAALSRHEIGYHTRYHSMPPVHPVAVEELSLEEGIAWVLAREAPGFAEVVETFRRVPVTYTPPGTSWTPATLLAMASLGIRLFVGNQFPRPCWYCGLFCVRYDFCLEGYFGPDGRGEEAFRRDFETRAAEVGPDGVIVLYSHPTRLVTSRFWDHPLYGGNEVALEAMPPAPLHSEADRARNRAGAERLVDWVVGQPGVEAADFAGIYAGAVRKGRRDLPVLLDEAGLKPGQEGRLPLRPEAGGDPGMNAYLSAFTYRWPPFPLDFTGDRLRRQMRDLAWTVQRLARP